MSGNSKRDLFICSIVENFLDLRVLSVWRTILKCSLARYRDIDFWAEHYRYVERTEVTAMVSGFLKKQDPCQRESQSKEGGGGHRIFFEL